MSTEMPDSCGACESAVTSADDGGRAVLAGAMPGGGPLRRSRSPICHLLAAEQAAEERAPRRLVAALAGDEHGQALDVLREARARRGVTQQEAAVDGVDDRDEVVGDRVRDRHLERVGDDVERDLRGLLVAVEDQLDLRLVVAEAVEEL